MHRQMIVLLIILSCFTYAAPLAAQSGGEICLLAYEDINQNGLHDPEEAAFNGVGVSLLTPDELIIGNHVTGDDPFCFQGMSPGAYTVRFESSPNHTATTESTAAIELAEGQRLRLEYGAVPQNPFLDEAPASSGDQVDTVTRLLISLLAAVVAMILMIGFGAIVMGFSY
ncbi:MAG: hypothetical protein K8I82_13560 [Anaerolineae bacterium]|nr:hypothetical protein [Anaerolineae bacterium]